jgi:GLPGLI family protein
MKTIQIFLVLGLMPMLCNAQFTKQGIITFEKITNIKRGLLTEESGDWVKEYAKNITPFDTATFTLSFNEEFTNYKFVPKEDNKKSFLAFFSLADKNHVFTFLKKNKVLAEKKAYENSYLVSDSIVHLKWKIEDEMRQIAGYTCRKAITTIDDSVVVVAFYTSQIAVSGGPESFNGLPGMILGIVIPRLYTTWFATNVELTMVQEKDFDQPSKGKKISYTDMYAEIRKGIKDWGSHGARVLWWMML